MRRRKIKAVFNTVHEFCLNLFHRASSVTGTSIRNKLILYFLMFSLIPLTIVGYISYTSFRSALYHKATEYSTDGSMKTVLNLEMKLKSYENISMELMANHSLNRLIRDYVAAEGGYELYLSAIAVQRSLQKYIFPKQDIATLIFMGDKKQHFIAQGVVADLTIDFHLKFWETDFYQQIVEANGRLLWYPSPYWTENRQEPYFLAGRLIKDLETNKSLGVFLLLVTESTLDQVINYGLYQDPGVQEIYSLLINGRGEIVSLPETAGKDNIGRNIYEIITGEPVLQNMLAGAGPESSFFTRLFNKEVLITVEQVGDYDWYLLGVTPTSYLYREVRAVGITTLILGFIFGGIAVCLSLLVAFNISSPLHRIAANAEKIATGNFEVGEVVVKTRDELQEISQAFNKMSRNIRMLFMEIQEKVQLERQLEEEKLRNLEIENLLRETEIQNLQSQINPHFLYNTLNAITQVAALENAEETGSLIQAVARLFRYNLRSLDKPVTVRDEIENIKEYIHIMGVRFGERIDCQVTCSGQPEKYLIPCMSLQPLLENAFIHGVAGLRNRKGLIRVEVREEEEERRLLIRIVDNGRGMPPEKVKNILCRQERVKEDLRQNPKWHTTGLGLGNIINRLTLFYKQNNLLSITSQVGKGTEVVLRIPLRDSLLIHQGSRQENKRSG